MYSQESFLLAVKHLCKLFSCLHIDVFGLDFVKKIIETKDLFVMGDISGILRNFSMQQTLQQQQKHRFAAVAWGGLDSKMPLQKFMRNNRYVPYMSFLKKTIADLDMYGELEIGVAKNISKVFDKNQHF